MAISLVGTPATHQAASGTSQTVTLTSTTAGNLLIAVLMSDAGIDTFSMPAGWTQLDSVVTNGDKTLALFYYPNNPGGITSVVCSRGSSLFEFTATIAEYSGVATSSPVDQHATKTGASSSSCTSTSITTTNAADLLICAVANDGTGFSGVTGGYTVRGVSTGGGEVSAYGDQIVSSTGSFSPTFTTSGGGDKWATINAAFKAAPIPNTPVPSTTIVAPSGGSRTNHMFYAVNTARWWYFYLSTASTITALYSTDGGSTWTAAAQTIALGQSINGWAFGVAYANISSTDVVHIAVNAINTSDSAKHFRTTLSSTNIASPSSITIGTSFYQFFDGPVTITPNFHILEVYAQGGDWNGEAWPNVDSGSSWTPGTAVTGPGAGNNFYVIAAIAATGNTAAVVVLDDSNAGTATSPASSASWGPTWGKWNGTSWSDQGSISGTSAITQKYNNLGLVARTTSDVHMVRRTSSTAFEHYRYNGTSWSAGSSIPTQANLDGGGIALASDGTNVYAFIIDSGGTNQILVSTWDGSSWSSWSGVVTSTAVRNNLTVSQTADGSGNWMVSWTEGSSSPWAVVVALFTPSGGVNPVALYSLGQTGVATLKDTSVAAHKGYDRLSASAVLKDKAVAVHKPTGQMAASGTLKDYVIRLRFVKDPLTGAVTLKDLGVMKRGGLSRQSASALLKDKSVAAHKGYDRLSSSGTLRDQSKAAHVGLSRQSASAILKPFSVVAHHLLDRLSAHGDLSHAIAGVVSGATAYAILSASAGMKAAVKVAHHAYEKILSSLTLKDKAVAAHKPTDHLSSSGTLKDKGVASHVARSGGMAGATVLHGKSVAAHSGFEHNTPTSQVKPKGILAHAARALNSAHATLRDLITKIGATIFKHVGATTGFEPSESSTTTFEASVTASTIFNSDVDSSES